MNFKYLFIFGPGVRYVVFYSRSQYFIKTYMTKQYNKTPSFRKGAKQYATKHRRFN